jgi:hypothetical protein
VRISTTTLESFRLWSQPDQDWMTEQSLVDSISGTFVPNDAVALGTAFGKILETPDAYKVDGGYRARAYHREYTFDDATMAEPLALIDRRGIFEAKATRRYGDCDVVAKADHLYGSRLAEFKTTTGYFDFDKYEASCQWRFMVDIFEPAMVTYHVFRLDDHGNGVVELRGIDSFNLYPYAALHQDCRDLLARFVDYVTLRGLDGLLRQRQADAA